MPRGSKPAPPGQSKRPEQQRHAWTPATAVGWQHGKVPSPPTGLMPASRKAWAGWFAAWYASFWQPDDEAMLRQIVILYDQVERGEFAAMTKLMPLLDRYGITPKGRQDLRWAPPVGEVDTSTDDLADELNKRREARRARISSDAI